eukprot:Amastigsp_a508540_93.p2 type:complete len:383 gc:universal Amastigsp_a508540_93:1587-439(-)
MVQVARRQYCCHEFEPDSRPPPVSFSPPKAPPISAPLVPALTFEMPVSEPLGPIQVNSEACERENSEAESPCLTELLRAIASSRVSNFIVCRIGTNISSWTTGAECEIAVIVGCTKCPRVGLPSDSCVITSPPTRILPPCALTVATPFLKISTERAECSGPKSTPSESGLPARTWPYALMSLAMNWSWTLLWRRSRRVDVQRCPAVPTAPKSTARTAMSTSPSSWTMTALLPPSSRIERPKRPWTVTPTLRPMCVEPVNDMSGSRVSADMASPMATSPQTSAEIAPGSLLASSTEAMIREVATEQSGVDGAPFHTEVLPHTMPSAAFHPKTATGKLNAETTPMTPMGFHCSRRTCPGRSEGMICPLSVRESPTAKSHMSMYS